MKTEPFKCSLCLERLVRTAVVEYETMAQHDGSLHKVKIPDLAVYQCGNPGCKNVKLPDAAQARVAVETRKKIGLLTGEEIKAAREAAGLTRLQLSERLGAPDAIIARWENNLALQPTAMDERIRDLPVKS